jgi:hypothetical protein
MTLWKTRPKKVRPFFDKSGKSSAPDFPGPTKFFSALFELCGRNFGPLATLATRMSYLHLRFNSLYVFTNYLLTNIDTNSRMRFNFILICIIFHAKKERHLRIQMAMTVFLLLCWKVWHFVSCIVKMDILAKWFSF